MKWIHGKSLFQTEIFMVAEILRDLAFIHLYICTSHSLQGTWHGDWVCIKDRKKHKYLHMRSQSQHHTNVIVLVMLIFYIIDDLYEGDHG